VLWFERLEEITDGEIDVRRFSKLNGERLDGFQIHESAYPVRQMGVVGWKGYHILAVGDRHLADSELATRYRGARNDCSQGT
jgi:hypothetical protein